MVIMNRGIRQGENPRGDMFYQYEMTFFDIDHVQIGYTEGHAATLHSVNRRMMDVVDNNHKIMSAVVHIWSPGQSSLTTWSRTTLDKTG